ncbi:MAG: ABC transporter permease subunit [Actinobacteria bacterium]|nr:ABC transporter permease subunit [Actinomycetota bacterium]MBI3687493.1 ABC transporter permease subunit [Actinomycetota bacterium]
MALPFSIAAAEAPNPWFSVDYVRDNSDTILAAIRQHVTLTAQAVLIAVVIAFPLALLARRFGVLAGPILGLSGALYAIPSLAMFAFLEPFVGLNQYTVLVGLVVYALVVLVQNFLVGLRSVPADVREAARGMGYGNARMLWRVEVPIALPVLMAGIRVATVSTVALTTVGVVVGNGGLGQIIFEGFNNNFYRAEIVTGSVLCVLLALAADAALAGLARLLAPWSRPTPTGSTA